jgi:hypothetical protein
MGISSCSGSADAGVAWEIAFVIFEISCLTFQKATKHVT